MRHWLFVVVMSIGMFAPVGCAAGDLTDPGRLAAPEGPLRERVPAALAGDATASAQLARAFELGLGTRRDFDAALRWRQLAAEQGDIESAFVMGRRYASGDGVDRDDREATRWFRFAADRGHAAAQLELAKILSLVDAPRGSAAEASSWYRRALDAGAVPSPPGSMPEIGPGTSPTAFPTQTDRRVMRALQAGPALRGHGRYARFFHGFTMLPPGPGMRGGLPSAMEGRQYGFGGAFPPVIPRHPAWSDPGGWWWYGGN